MIRKRLALAAVALCTLVSTLVMAEPAEAHGPGRGRGYYGRRAYYGGDSCYRPRRSSYRRYSYGRRFYRPRTRVVYVNRYDYDYAPSFRHASYGRSYGRGYSCGCGSRFQSAYWLDYHRDHGGCG